MSEDVSLGYEYTEKLKQAIELEQRAKETWDDLKTKARLFAQAAKIRKELNDEDGEIFCTANYHYAQGLVHLENGLVKEAIQNLWQAIIRFLSIGIISMALHALEYFSRTSSKHEEYVTESVDKVEYALLRVEEYPTITHEDELKLKFLKIKLSTLIQKTKILRRKKTLESLIESRALHLEAIRIATQLEKTDLILHTKYSLSWVNIKIARIQNQDPVTIGELYLKAAELAQKIGDTTHHLALLADAAKWMARHHFPSKRHDEFFDQIENAMKMAEETGDERLLHYCLGLKHRKIADMAKRYQTKLLHLHKAKEFFYKGGDQHSGKFAEYHLHLLMADYEKNKGNLKEYLNILEKIIRIAKSLEDDASGFELEKIQIQSLVYLKEEHFEKAYNAFTQFLKELEQTGPSRRYYERMIHIHNVLGYLFQTSFSHEDVSRLIEYLYEAGRSSESSFTFKVYSLLNTWVSIQVHGIKTQTILKHLKKRIIELIIKQEDQKETRRELVQTIYLSQFEWYQKYPDFIIHEYETFEWFLSDSPDDLKDTPFDYFFRKVLEPLLRIIVEFNAKLTWRTKWQEELQELVQDYRPVESYTLGVLIKSFEKLRQFNKNYCRQIQDNTIELLSHLVTIRNKFTHGTIQFDEDQLLDNVRLILMKLHVCTPILILVKQKRGSGYRAKILWGFSPKQITLKTQESLQPNTVFYTTPFIIGEEREFEPDTLISAKQGAIQYQEFRTRIGQSETISDYKEQFISRKGQKPLTLLKSLVDELVNQIISIIEKGNVPTQRDFHIYFREAGHSEYLSILISKPNKLLYFLWDIYKASFKFNKEKSFRIPSLIFQFCLDILEYYSISHRKKMISQYIQTVPAMFRNMILGDRGVGHYIRIDNQEDLYSLIADFETYFFLISINAPSTQQILIELKSKLSFLDEKRRDELEEKMRRIFQ